MLALAPVDLSWGAGQTVAVIDSGIAYDQKSLGGGIGPSRHVVGGWDFAESDANPYDDGPAGFHGTHIAGIIGSTSPTHPGVAPGADLVALRVFDDHGQTRVEWIEAALLWVVEHQHDFRYPITTINLALGSAWNSDQVPDWSRIEEELQSLHDAGILVAVSAGNRFASYGVTGLSYPAASPAVLPVASVDADGTLSRFSQRSERVLAAQGRDIVSAVPDYLLGADGILDDFAAASGTSMAAAYVAGAAAVVRQRMEAAANGPVGVDAVVAALRRGADLVWDPVTQENYERVNLARTLAQIGSPPTPTGSSNNGGSTHSGGTTGTPTGGTSASVCTTTTDTQGHLILKLDGTAGNDLFEVTVGANPVVVINGVPVSCPLVSGQSVRLQGGTGTDRLQLDVLAANTWFAVTDSEWRVTGGPVEFTGNGFEQIVANSLGTATRASLSAATSLQRLAAWPDRTRWQAGSLTVTLNAWPAIDVQGSAAGLDTAVLHGGRGGERLLAGLQQAVWFVTGARVTLNGFDYVNATDGAAGTSVVSFVGWSDSRNPRRTASGVWARVGQNTAYALRGYRIEQPSTATNGTGASPPPLATTNGSTDSTGLSYPEPSSQSTSLTTAKASSTSAVDALFADW